MRFRAPCSPVLARGLALLWVSAGLASAQAWRSTLYPENWQRPDESSSFSTDKLIQDFSYAGYRRGEQAVPEVTGPVFDAVATYGADPTGATDSTTQIQAAIDAAEAAGGGVVSLPAGSYTISPQGGNSHCLIITESNVVLRGAGPANTFLLNTETNMRSKKVLRVSPSASTGSSVALTADVDGVTHRLHVASASSFAVGDVVRIEWDFTDEWIAEHSQGSYWSEAGNSPASAKYFREVTASNDSQGWIEIDAPTRYAMKARDNARVSKVTGMVTGVGIEDLAIGNVQNAKTTWGESDYTVAGTGGYEAHQSYLIDMRYAYDCWIDQVESFQPAGNTTTCHMLSNGILVSDSMRVTVADCMMQRPQYGGGGGNGYMYRLQYTSESLLKNCVAEFSRHGLVVSHAGTSGNVFLQCEDRETKRATGNTGSYTTSGSGSDHHMHFSHSNLFDGCSAHNSFYSAAHRINYGTVGHGLTSAHGLYWNTIGSGTRYNNIVNSDQGRYGYVIGTSGAKSGVSTSSLRTNTGTAPLDHVEGQGIGDELLPASLYLDQLARRTAPAVTYRGNGNTGGSAPVDGSSPYSPGATVTVLGAGDLSRTDFTFNGWNTEPDGSGTSYAVSSPFAIDNHLTLYAQWLGAPVTVHFDANGGTTPSPTSKVVSNGVAYGTLATTSRSGYVFEGWFTAASGGTAVTSSTVVNAASTHTLYAQWLVTPVSGPLTSQDQIVGERQANAPALGYYPNTGESLVGSTGSTASATRKCVNLVLGYSLPTLPVGTTVDAATFRFEITANRDQSGSDPLLQVHLLDVANPDASADTHYSHGSADGSAATTLVDATYLAVGTDEVAYPDDQQDRAFVLSGAALSLVQGYYGGDHLPERSEVFFRFSLSTDPGVANLDRYRVDLAADESVLEITPTAQSEFHAWVEAHGTGAETFAGDDNGDGVANGIAWLLGADSPSQQANALLPGFSESEGELRLSFQFLTSTARGASTLKLQYSRDLGITDLWTNHTVTVPDSSGTVDGVAFIITPVEGDDVQQVEVTIPATAAGGTGRIFARLLGELP